MKPTEVYCEFCDEHEDYKEAKCLECGLEIDEYGNTEDSFKFCSFPDCGCDGARNCMAPSGASHGANSLNLEKGCLEYIL